MCIIPTDLTYKFSSDDIIDLPKLIERLRSHPDAICSFVWEKLSKEDQVMLVNYQATGSTSSQCQAILVQAFNKILSEPSIYGDRFRGILLRPDTFALTLYDSTYGGAQPHLNRLLLEDAFPTELSRAIKPRSTQFKVTEPVVLTITITNLGGSGRFHVPTRSAYDPSFSYFVITPSGKTLRPHADSNMNGGSGSNLSLEPFKSLQFTCDLGWICKFDEIGVYTITVSRVIGPESNDEPWFTVVSNPLSIQIVPDK
jgi:hypothetical protein